MIQIDWTKYDCGLIRTPFMDAYDLMPPEFGQILDTFKPERSPWEYTIDVKVHMLMPGQYPCIPNWHFDMVPRDENLVQQFDQCTDDKLYLWLSGPPITEFRDGREISPQEWIEFTQRDEHRGIASTEHQWRCFIRCCPVNILPPLPPEKWMRRHSQVYLDATNFKW